MGISLSESTVREMLLQSNAIEDVFDAESLEEAHEAWDYAITECLGQGFFARLDKEYLLGIHQRLMHRQNPRIAGKFRDCLVEVGTRLCPPPGMVSGLLTECLGKIYDSKLEGVITNVDEMVEKCCRLHVAFEKVHPFEDGNGRVGRILYNMHRLAMGGGIGIHVLKASERGDYYKWFTKHYDEETP